MAVSTAVAALGPQAPAEVVCYHTNRAMPSPPPPSDAQADEQLSQWPLLPEYEEAAAKLFLDAINAFMRAQDPVLARIKSEEVSHISAHSHLPNVTHGAYSGPIGVSFVAILEHRDIFAVNADAWIHATWNAATKALDAFMPQFFESMNRIVEQGGNIVSGGDKPFSWDLAISALEAMELESTETGQPKELTLICGPELAEKLRVTPINAEQERRWEAVITRKREEFNTRRRHRKLD